MSLPENNRYEAKRSNALRYRLLFITLLTMRGTDAFAMPTELAPDTNFNVLRWIAMAVIMCTVLAYGFAITNLFLKQRLLRILSYAFAIPLAVVALLYLVYIPYFGVIGLGLVFLLWVIIKNSQLAKHERFRQ